MRINRTAERTIQMLELVGDHPRGLSLAEITEIMDLPKTSAYDILMTLKQTNMVELIDKRSKVYGLGVKSFVIGSKYIDEIEMVKIARPYIEKLGGQLDKTVFFGILNSDKIIYLDKFRPAGEILTTCQIGAENGVHCTALGKAILANKADRSETIDQLDLYSKTDYTITDVDALNEELDKIQKQGYAVDDREHMEHMLCAAAPVFDHTGEVVAAISITGLYLPDKDYTEEFMIIKEIGKEISMKLGYRE